MAQCVDYAIFGAVGWGGKGWIAVSILSYLYLGAEMGMLFVYREMFWFIYRVSLRFFVVDDITWDVELLCYEIVMLF